MFAGLFAFTELDSWHAYVGLLQEFYASILSHKHRSLQLAGQHASVNADRGCSSSSVETIGLVSASATLRCGLSP